MALILPPLCFLYYKHDGNMGYEIKKKENHNCFAKWPLYHMPHLA